MRGTSSFVSAPALRRCAFSGVVVLLVSLAAFGVSQGQARAQSSQDFAAWLADFRAVAARSGVSKPVIDRAFQGVGLNRKVVERDRAQPEFATPVWDYLDSLVSDKRVTDGREAIAKIRLGLDAIAAKYGTPAEVVAAIWGVESNFGQNRGKYYVIEALATLAYDGRRAEFGREQLIEALKILEAGDVMSDRMVGSWAGAMGHTQFIPTSFRDFAVDFTGDGKRDIWADDPLDALASTANYLKENGWSADEPWGFEVALPSGFDYSLVGDIQMPTPLWAERGLRLKDGGALPGPFENAQLILPAGAEGPAFLVLGNFRTILRYNNATSYALAVSLLAERLSGLPPRALAWPRGETPLNLDERRELQQSLTELGFAAGSVDGLLGPRTRSAVRDFQRSQSLIPDGFPSRELLELVRSAANARNAPVLQIAAGGEAEIADIREIQALLSALGYGTGGIDGEVGPRTRRAISRFVRQRGLPATDEPSLSLLNELRQTVRGE